jgi:hypothetical protein
MEKVVMLCFKLMMVGSDIYENFSHDSNRWGTQTYIPQIQTRNKNLNCEVSLQPLVTWNKPTILILHTAKNTDKD